MANGSEGALACQHHTHRSLQTRVHVQAVDNLNVRAIGNVVADKACVGNLAQGRESSVGGPVWLQLPALAGFCPPCKTASRCSCKTPCADRSAPAGIPASSLQGKRGRGCQRVVAGGACAHHASCPRPQGPSLWSSARNVQQALRQRAHLCLGMRAPQLGFPHSSGRCDETRRVRAPTGLAMATDMVAVAGTGRSMGQRLCSEE